MGGHGGMGGFGGMGDGNTDKLEYSAKGIKAANTVVINGGEINIKAYDDAIHANIDTALENGASPLGNVTVKGGNVTVYSNDDGLHADGRLSVEGGTVTVTNSYEGLEGTSVSISGGHVSVTSDDDGINGTATSGTAIEIGGGSVYIYCKGDGIDSNSRSSYSGIVFSGGRAVVISNSNGNSAIDSEQGYKYTGGYVIAVMPRGGMSGEATHCQNFSDIGKTAQISLTAGGCLRVSMDSAEATVKMPASVNNALVIVLGDRDPDISADNRADTELEEGCVLWS